MNAVYPSLVLAVFVFITLQFLRLCCRAFVAGVHRAADRCARRTKLVEGAISRTGSRFESNLLRCRHAPGLIWSSNGH